MSGVAFGSVITVLQDSTLGCESPPPPQPARRATTTKAAAASFMRGPRAPVARAPLRSRPCRRAAGAGSPVRAPRARRAARGSALHRRGRRGRAGRGERLLALQLQDDLAGREPRRRAIVLGWEAVQLGDRELAP